MSRIGKKPVSIPSGVTLSVQDGTVKAHGPLGDLVLDLHPDVSLSVDGSSAVVSVKDESVKQQKALWGLFRALVGNLVTGVTSGFSKQLEVNGVGFKVTSTPKELTLMLGYSHPVVMPIPQGLTVTVEKNVITISGSNKQKVGQFAAEVRDMRAVEPYKGKGIRYVGESVRRKAGKAAKSGAK